MQLPIPPIEVIPPIDEPTKPKNAKMWDIDIRFAIICMLEMLILILSQKPKSVKYMDGKIYYSLFPQGLNKKLIQ